VPQPTLLPLIPVLQGEQQEILNECKTKLQVFERISSFLGVYEEFYLLGYEAVQSIEILQTFRRKILPPSSGSKNKSLKKPE
jgi:hypothetical protein